MDMTDKIETEIKNWIQQADDPKDKALLLILFQMNTNLVENTHLTKGVSEQFAEHKTKIDGLLNRLRGGWLVFGFTVIALQAMGMWIINGQFTNLERQHDVNAAQELTLTRMENQLNNNARRIGATEDQIRAIDRYHTDLNLGTGNRR